MSKLPDSLTTIMESSVNRYLALDPSSEKTISKLEGRSAVLYLKEFSFPVYFKFENQRIKVLPTFEGEPDVNLVMPLSSLAGMALASPENESILGNEIEMTGNVDVGREFRNIFRNLDIDWEEIVSRYTGDIIAHKLGNGVRQIGDWFGAAKSSLQQDVTEYLQEESQQLPAEREVDVFIENVDELRLSVERAEARIKILKNNLEKNDH